MGIEKGDTFRLERRHTLSGGHQRKLPRGAGCFAASSWLQISYSHLLGNCLSQIITGLSLGTPGEMLTEGRSGLDQVSGLLLAFISEGMKIVSEERLIETECERKG